MVRFNRNQRGTEDGAVRDSRVQRAAGVGTVNCLFKVSATATDGDTHQDCVSDDKSDF